jgi:hypothetical protein
VQIGVNTLKQRATSISRAEDTFTLQMEATDCSRMLAVIYHMTQHQIPGDKPEILTVIFIFHISGSI